MGKKQHRTRQNPRFISGFFGGAVSRVELLRVGIGEFSSPELGFFIL